MVQPTGELRMVKVEEVFVDPSRNPRGPISKSDIAELVASVRENGVTTPVLCASGPEGLELVAGYRRMAAAQEAGVAEVPTYVRDAERRDTYALIENLPGLRRDMAPIAEARAMKAIAAAERLDRRALAKRLGKSRSFVSERLGMLRLPDPVQEVLACGRPAPSAVPQLLAIAKVSEPAAVRVAELAAADESVERALRKEPERVVRNLAGVLKAERDGEEGDAPRPPAEGELVAVELGFRGVDVGELALSDGRRAELGRRVLALEGREGADFAPGERLAVGIDEDDVDALRALGVLLEYGDEEGFYVRRFCFDSVVLADRIEATLERLEREVAAAREEELVQAREAAARGGADGEGAEQLDPEKLLARKAAEAKERERRKQREKQEAARRLNLDLGRRLLKRRSRRRSEKRRRELVRALCLHAVASEEHLGGLGPRLTYEAWQKVEQRTLKSGRPGAVKVTYLDPREASERLRRELVGARQLDEILDVIGDALVGATYSSEEELPVSRRVRYYQGSLRHVNRGPIRKAIDEEANGVLPPELAVSLRRSQELGYGEKEYGG